MGGTSINTDKQMLIVAIIYYSAGWKAREKLCRLGYFSIIGVLVYPSRHSDVDMDPIKHIISRGIYMIMSRGIHLKHDILSPIIDHHLQKKSH